MIQLQLINADIIYDTAIVTSQLFRKSFNCRYIPRMDYAFFLLTLKRSEKWWSPLFGATCNFNHQIQPYGILFLTFINTNVFYLLSNFHANLLRPWRFPLSLFLDPFLKLLSDFCGKSLSRCTIRLCPWLPLSIFS